MLQSAAGIPLLYSRGSAQQSPHWACNHFPLQKVLSLSLSLRALVVLWFEQGCERLNVVPLAVTMSYELPKSVISLQFYSSKLPRGISKPPEPAVLTEHSLQGVATCNSELYISIPHIKISFGLVEGAPCWEPGDDEFNFHYFFWLGLTILCPSKPKLSWSNPSSLNESYTS